MKHKLTDRFVRTVKPPTRGRLVVADTEVKGLSLRVTPNGTRSFLVRYRPRRQPQKAYTIPGAYPDTTLAAARQRAREIVSAAKRGADLLAEEKLSAAEQMQALASMRTVAELAAEYVENHCKPHQRQWKNVEARLRNHALPKLGKLQVTDIRRADIVELLDDIEHRKGLRQQVNRTRSDLYGMFRYAEEREYVVVNPVVGTRLRKNETERSRTLTDEELRAIWQALSELPDPGRSFVRTLMLTATRRDEARGMQWAEIAPAGDVWLLPASRNKSEREFEIPLPTPMKELLALLPKRGPCVFSVDGNRPWTGHHWFKLDLDAKSGVTGWVLHDIRRTVRSRLAELGVSYEIAERVLNHAVTRLERTYNRHAYSAEKKLALQMWANRLMSIVNGPQQTFQPPEHFSVV